MQEKRTGRINRLMTAVIQEQDVVAAMKYLRRLQVSITRLPSTGGFLGRRSATLLIGYEAGQEEVIVKTLAKSCRTRVEYITVPLEGSTLPIASPTPVTVGGATIFTFEIERFEEI